MKFGNRKLARVVLLNAMFGGVGLEPEEHRVIDGEIVGVVQLKEE